MGVWVGHLRDFHGIALVPHEVHAALIDAVGCGGAAEGLLRSSAFFLPSRGAEWRRGFSSFLNEDWWAACAQLTVLLESGLRRAHAACNGADAMWRIPEEDRLFATVDDLLAPRHTAKVVESRQGGGVPTPGGVEGVEAEAEAEAEAESARPANATLGFLGPGATSVLYDHWVWTEGVRARDDVAHASVLPEDVPPEASSAVLAVALWCAVRCCPEGVGAGGLGVVLRWVEGYRAQLSPWSLFGAESRLYTGKAREALRARCALVAERGSGFPPPPAGSKVVTVEERDSLNARRSDDPNRLPGDAAGLAAEVRALRGGGGGGGVPEPDIASLVFSGKITNATNRELIKFGMLRKIVAACYSFAERLAGTYDSMFDLVWSRRAYKKQRISYARLVMDIGDLADMADLAFEFAQLNATRDIDSGELLRESCLNFIYSLMHQAELKQWYRCLPEYAAFTEKLKEFLAQQPPPPPG